MKIQIFFRFLSLLSFHLSFRLGSSADAKIQKVTAVLYKDVVNYQSDSTVLNLQFSEDLIPVTIPILQNSIDIQLKGLTSNVDFKWTVTSQQSNSLFKIKMQYISDVYIKQLYLYFTNPYAIKTNATPPNYLSLEHYVISVQVGPVVTFSSSSEVEIQIMQILLIIIIIGSCALYIILYFFRFLKESLNLFWAFVDIMQLYNLFLFIDTNVFDNVSKLLKTGEYLNFWYENFIKSANDSLYTSFQESSTTTAQSSLPIRFIVENYQTYFLQNALFPVVILIVMLILVLISYIVCPSSRFGISGVFRNTFQFSLPIRMILICSCQIFISAFLFFKNFQGVLNQLFCIIFVLFYIVASTGFLYLLNKGQPIPLKEQASKEKYGKLILICLIFDQIIAGSLYEGLILKAILKRNFNLFFMVRKIIMASFIVFLDNSEMIQIIFLFVIQIIFMGLVASKLPYEFGLNNLWMTVSEFLISLYLLQQSIWIIFDYLGEDFISINSRLSLSWTMHSTIIISVLSRVIGFFFEGKYIYNKEKLAQSQEKQFMIDNQLEENSNLMNAKIENQKLKLYHNQMKGNILENQEEEIQNPDDFQFIEQPDIKALIEQQKNEEKEELQQENENNQIQDLKENDNNHNFPSEEEEDDGSINNTNPGNSSKKTK